MLFEILEKYLFRSIGKSLGGKWTGVCDENKKEEEAERESKCTMYWINTVLQVQLSVDSRLHLVVYICLACV